MPPMIQAVWPFADAPDKTVFTTRSIVEDREPILRVYHDQDGDWQFHHESDPSMDDALVLALGKLVELDETISKIADLPCGWMAWRNDRSGDWRRAKGPETSR